MTMAQPDEKQAACAAAPTRRRTPKTVRDARSLLRDAAPDAARVLVDTMQDPDAKPELRRACAEAVLDRVYGKTPARGAEPGAGAAVCVFSEEQAQRALEELGYVRRG